MKCSGCFEEFEDGERVFRTEPALWDEPTDDTVPAVLDGMASVAFTCERCLPPGIRAQLETQAAAEGTAEPKPEPEPEAQPRKSQKKGAQQ